MREDTAYLIDSEPMLVLGCSGKELISLAFAGLVVGIIIGLLLALITGIWMLAVLPPVLVAPFFVYSGGKKLGRAKEGKPDGYFNRMLSVKLTKIGFINTYVLRTGFWRVRR